MTVVEPEERAAEGTEPRGVGAAKPPERSWKQSRMLNVWIDDLDMSQLMEQLHEGVVFTLNPDHLHHLHHNRDFYEAYRRADFITSDSKYVFWGTKFVGRGIQAKVSGSDIVPTYCDHHATNPDVKVFFLGAKPGIAQEARRRTNERVGRELVVGAHSPSMQFVTDEAEIEAVIQLLNDSGATCVIVGLGAPKQEIWIQRYKHRCPGVKVWMGVGATIDYEAGAVKRAPRWMTRNGLEWVFRITTEPRRYWRRYLRDMSYFWMLFKDRLGLYRSPW